MKMETNFMRRMNMPPCLSTSNPGYIYKKKAKFKHFTFPGVLTNTRNIKISHHFHSENYIFKGLFLDYSPPLRGWKIQLLTQELDSLLFYQSYGSADTREKGNLLKQTKN